MIVPFAILGAGPASAASVGSSLSTTDKRELQREVRLIIDLLQNFHYAERSFHEIEGTEIVARYLDALDPGGAALTKADGEFLFRRFGRSLKTVYLLKGDVQPAFEIFDFFAARSRERLDWIDARLDREFDFTADAVLAAGALAHPPADRAAADKLWELRLKNDVLEELLEGRDLPAAVEAVRKRYTQWRRQLGATDAVAVRETFLETLVNLFDPHSGYFSADSSREFELEMEGAVGGVGLDLRKEAGQCIVAGVRAGGPAEAEGSIMPGDRVVAVARSEGEPVQAATTRLRELVVLLRGEPGTSVRLWTTTPDAPDDDAGHEVVLQRARVILPEERARGRVVAASGTDGDSHRIGWIDLPSFYVAGENADAASATRDVRELIEAMQARPGGIAALVLDLRRNPGGALVEAVALSGLFVPGGIVMATRGLDGSITVHRAEAAPSALYTGPLVVLTSPRSASASEILAGSLRYHRRALLVGGTSTFGKGTVQNYIDLEKSPARGTGGPGWGTLRLTAEQFFFPDGASVQRTGAKSHVVLPGMDDDDRDREAELPHALRAETITVPDAAPAEGDFARVDGALVDWLRARLEERVAALPEFAAAKERRELLEELNKDVDESLVLATRRQEEDERDARVLALRRSRGTLAAEVAWPFEVVDTTEVSSAIATQEATLRPRIWPDGGNQDGRLWGHHFWFIDPRGALGSVELDEVPYQDFVGDADALAAAFAEASGLTLSAEDFRTVWQEVRRLDHPSDRAIRAVFARHVHPATDAESAALGRGVDAVFRRAAAIDGSWLVRGPLLDVAGREAIRLASDWAERQGKAGSAGQ